MVTSCGFTGFRLWDVSVPRAESIIARASRSESIQKTLAKITRTSYKIKHAGSKNTILYGTILYYTILDYTRLEGNNYFDRLKASKGWFGCSRSSGVVFYDSACIEPQTVRRYENSTVTGIRTNCEQSCLVNSPGYYG